GGIAATRLAAAEDEQPPGVDASGHQDVEDVPLLALEAGGFPHGTPVKAGGRPKLAAGAGRGGAIGGVDHDGRSGRDREGGGANRQVERHRSEDFPVVAAEEAQAGG